MIERGRELLAHFVEVLLHWSESKAQSAAPCGMRNIKGHIDQLKADSGNGCPLCSVMLAESTFESDEMEEQ